jgi:Asp-tRNA(Asn)/Glu-tRNA(Gln) amidotransferase A subunit family amidase
MARRNADLRLALGILSAPDVRDPPWVPAPLDGPAIDGPVRVAVVRDPLGAGIDPQVRVGVDRAAGWLADAGYHVVDAEPPQIAEATGVGKPVDQPAQLAAWGEDLILAAAQTIEDWAPGLTPISPRVTVAA